MNSVELVKQICKERKIPISKLERECNFSNGYINKLKEGKFPSDRLMTIANYLGVSEIYLMTGGVGISQHQKEYYYNKETADMAQQIFENRDMRLLFDAARNSKPEDLKMAADLLERLKGTNPDA